MIEFSGAAGTTPAIDRLPASSLAFTPCIFLTNQYWFYSQDGMPGLYTTGFTGPLPDSVADSLLTVSNNFVSLAALESIGAQATDIEPDKFDYRATM